MRHSYRTRCIVLSRTVLGEASLLVTLLTQEMGVVRVRVQGVRRSGAKLAAALATFSESDCTLIRGKEYWRLAGAVLVEPWFTELSPSAREAGGRVAGLLMRLVPGESPDERLFSIMHSFFAALAKLSDSADALEMLAVLMILQTLGVDAGLLPNGAESFSPEACTALTRMRVSYIERINKGIAASGL